MNIRMLQSKDAPYMLEWMSDKNVTEFLIYPYIQIHFSEG